MGNDMYLKTANTHTHIYCNQSKHEIKKGECQLYLPDVMAGLKSPSTDTLVKLSRSLYSSPHKYFSASWIDAMFTGQEILFLDKYITIFKINF